MPDTKSPQEQLAALRERRLILELEREQRLFESEERAAREERVAHARGLGVNLESLAVRAVEERNAAVRRAAQEESPAADAFALHESYSYYDWFDQAPYGQATDWQSVWGTGVGPILNPISTRMDRRQGRMLPFLQTEQDLMLMRGVARIITTLSCPAQGVLNALTNYVVGEKGFQFTVDAKHEKQKKQLPDGLIEAVQDVLQEFAEQAHWEDLQAELFLRSRRDGEYFLALYESPGGSTKVRIFEPEQITQTGSDRWTANYIRSEHGQELVDDGDWYWGILTPLRDVCEVHGFNVYWDMLGESEYLPAAAVQHFKLSDRNVKRGLSDFYPAFRMLQKSGNLANKIVSGAAVQAGIAYIRQHPPGRTQSDIISFRAGQADSTNTLLQPFGGTRTVYNQIRQEAGILDVPNGQEYKYGPMGAPSGNQFIDVLQASLRWVACKWNMPEFLVSGDASNNNMASSLVAESPFVKSVRFLQHRYGPRWVSVLWKVIEHAAAWGRFDRFGEYGDFHVLRRVLAISVGYPDVETRNRKEESDRRKQLCDDGMISPATRCAEEGYDYEKEVAKGAKQRPAEISAQASGIGADGQVTGVKAKGGGEGGNNQGGAGPGTEPPTDGGPGSGGSPKPPEGGPADADAPQARETEANESASVYETSTFEAKDAAGHEHKGKGPGGGQFTSSGDSGGSSKENPSKPKAAKPKPSTPEHAKKSPANPSNRDEVADKTKGKAFKDWFEGSRNQDVLSEDHPAVPALKKMFGDRLIQDAIDNAEDLPSLIRGQIGSKKFTETLQRHGYDGFLRKYNPESYEWTAFEPNQIKSAVHNRGTFDRNSDKITETTGSVQPSAMLDISGYGASAGLDDGRKRKPLHESFDESKHPRGQPGNPGQFGSGASGRKSGAGRRLSTTERNAIEDYSGDKFQSVNKQLRAGSTDKDVQRTVKALDSALSKLPAYDGPATFRRSELTPELAANLEVGKTIYDPGYFSTSKNKPVAIPKGTVAFQVVGKNGRDISEHSLNPGEKEVLYPRGTKFRVVKVSQKEHGGRIAILQEIDGDKQRNVHESAADIRDAIGAAADATERNPTDAQKESGNYAKGRFSWYDLPITIETPKGAVRSKGGEWSIKLPAHYGYFRRTESGADGDAVDVFIGPDPESQLVFVVDQVRADGSFDEHKCLIGYLNEADAIDAYKAAYPAGWKVGPITAMTLGQFKDWLASGDTSKPLALHESAVLCEDGHDVSHQPRDHGKFSKTPGASGEHKNGGKEPDHDLQFFSENVGEGKDLDEALAMKDKPRHKWAKAKCDEIDHQLGIKSKLEEAIGDWTDGSESSFMSRSKSKATFDDLKYAAALKGFFLKQKSVVAFKNGKGGPDRVYHIDIKDTPEQIRKILDAHKIENRTLTLHKGHVTVTIFDEGQKLLDNVNRFSEDYGDDIIRRQLQQGQGACIGASDRKQALTVYRDVIAAHERQTAGVGRHYRDSRGRGFADYWRRAGQDVEPHESASHEMAAGRLARRAAELWESGEIYP